MTKTVERFTKTRFASGDSVRLKNPADHAHVFDEPSAPLEVAAVHYFDKWGAATYALQAKGCPCVTPFTDDDLMPA